MAKNHLLKMMILKNLVQGLQLIETFLQLADKDNFHKQVSSTQIEKYFMRLIVFSNIYSLLYLSLIFIEHQSHHSSENKPERNWNSNEV